MLKQDTALSALDLKSNDIGVEGGAALFNALKSNITLTELDLGILSGGNRNRVGSKVAGVMKDMLSCNSALTSLSLYGNGLGVEGSAEFASGLEQNTVLKSLDLGLNGLKDDGTWTLAGALERAALETLNLANNGIGTKGVKRMAQVLSSGKLLLQSLDLSSNKVSDKAASLLGDALAHNSLLQTLHLDRNEITQEACIALSHGMLSRSLSVLTLSVNGIRDGGAGALAKVLRRNTALTRLDLASNQIGDVGATQVANMLIHNSGINTLSLADNTVGDAGGVLLSNALLQNETLRSLNLRGNQLHDVTGSAMVAGLRGNTGLTELDVSWNDINYSNFRSIEKLIQEHAAAYRQGAVPRLKKELQRLKKEEPKLAIREAELAEVSEERDGYLAECRKLQSDYDRTLVEEAQKLEECEAAKAEAKAEYEQRSAEHKVVKEKFEALEKGKGKELAEQQKKTDRGAVDLGRMTSEIESLEQEIAKVLDEQAEEEAQHELQVAELRQQCEEQEKILIELRQKQAELDALREEATIAAEAAAEAASKGRNQIFV
uniref:Uncharacterized protein n=1 Tax=Hemiselmis tepida TaxID=464990 RepID=A0A7S0W5W3_9CRYP